MATSLGEGKIWIQTCKASLKIDLVILVQRGWLTRVHTHTHTHTHTHIYIYIYLFIYLYICIYIYCIDKYKYIYLHIHTYLHTHTHTYKCRKIVESCIITDRNIEYIKMLSVPWTVNISIYSTNIAKSCLGRWTRRSLVWRWITKIILSRSFKQDIERSSFLTHFQKGIRFLSCSRTLKLRTLVKIVGEQVSHHFGLR